MVELFKSFLAVLFVAPFPCHVNIYNQQSVVFAVGPHAVSVCVCYLQLSTVTLFSLLHVAVATLLPPVEHLDLGHVVQAHAHALLQTGCQVLLTAGAEHRGERVPEGDGERGG